MTCLACPGLLLTSPMGMVQLGEWSTFPQWMGSWQSLGVLFLGSACHWSRWKQGLGMRLPYSATLTVCTMMIALLVEGQGPGCPLWSGPSH